MFCFEYNESMTQSESLDKPLESRQYRWSKWLGCIATLLIFSLPLILFILLLPSIQYAREAGRCAMCVRNMKAISVALQNYHKHHGSFPPAYTVDAEGNPLHSWRTLILPYFAPGVIGPQWKGIYDQIRFDEPWDSEHNRQFNEYVEHAIDEERRKYHSTDPDHDIDYGFHHNMPAVYGCPNYLNDVVKTVYKMVVGDNALGNVYGTSLGQLTRSPSETVLVVEAGLPVPWMSPVDFTVDDFQTAVYPNDRERVREIHEATYWHAANPELAKRQILGGEHGRQLHILFADGNVKIYWDWKMPISDIEAMSRIRE